MDKHRPWQPKIRRAPLFNPFEASTQWTAQIGADDRIEIEDDEETGDGVPTTPASETTADKG